YYDNATLHIYLASGKGEYESLRKRHVFYEANVLHRNSLKGWKWISDIFAVALILIALTGLLIPQGKNGALRGGEWYMAAGLLLPTGAVALFYLLT
ncbi:MAG TPA: PepSY-associated TM helix domain-containing protein, partial [Turneriella sp.]|nr:PepSY-associated TM helix domain-containing protein [Turneriella sp.]